MNYFDIIVAIPILWFGYKGYTKGFVIEIASLAALILGIWGGIKLSSYAASIMINDFGWESQYIPLISFGVVFIIIVICVHLVAKLVDKLVKAVSLSFINRIAGAIFGAFKVLLVISLILMIFNRIDEKSDFISDDFKEGSLLYKPIAGLAPAILPVVDQVNFKNENKKTIE
ncbi:MAG: CvpA family protein [Bacteroidota bacterium]